MFWASTKNDPKYICGCYFIGEELWENDTKSQLKKIILEISYNLLMDVLSLAIDKL